MDICVIYGSGDEAITGHLVTLLKKHWDVWWAGDINKGDWEEAVRRAIKQARAVIPVISGHSVKKPIFKDELAYANKNNRDIFFVRHRTLAAKIRSGDGQVRRAEGGGAVIRRRSSSALVCVSQRVR